jgi:hypothetical protein
MITPRAKPLLRSLAASLAVLIAVQGCYSWRVEVLQPQQAAEHGRPMRLTFKDGKRRVLWDARFAGDSVIGFGGWISDYSGLHRRRQALATQDVERAETRYLNEGQTAFAAVVLSAVTVLGIVGLAAFNRSLEDLP